MQLGQRAYSAIPFARWTSGVVGALLIALAFSFDQDYGARINCGITGAVVIAVAWWAARTPGIRVVNAILGVWLVVSSPFIFERSPHAAVWSQVIAGVLLILISLPRWHRNTHTRVAT